MENKMSKQDKAIELLEEEIHFIEDCPDGCKHIDAHAHKAGLKQLLVLLRQQAEDLKEAIELLERVCEEDLTRIHLEYEEGAEKKIRDARWDCAEKIRQALALLRQSVQDKICAECGEKWSARHYHSCVGSHPPCKTCGGSGEVQGIIHFGGKEVKYKGPCPDCQPKPDFQTEVGTWAEKQFNQSTNKSICIHLQREVKELSDSFSKEEAADCFILLLHFAYKNKFDLLAEARKKHEINKNREWGELDEEGVVEHICQPKPEGEFTKKYRQVLDAVVIAFATKDDDIVTTQVQMAVDRGREACAIIDQQAEELERVKAFMECSIGLMAEITKEDILKEK